MVADLEQVGAELAKRAEEITAWLDAAADGHPPGDPTTEPESDPPIGTAIARVDLSCYQALASAAARLVAASASVRACAQDMRDTDAELARQMCRWVP